MQINMLIVAGGTTMGKTTTLTGFRKYAVLVDAKGAYIVIGKRIIFVPLDTRSWKESKETPEQMVEEIKRQAATAVQLFPGAETFEYVVTLRLGAGWASSAAPYDAAAYARAGRAAGFGHSKNILLSPSDRHNYKIGGAPTKVITTWDRSKGRYVLAPDELVTQAAEYFELAA